MTRRPFSLVRQTCKRNIVVHHTHILNHGILDLIQLGDIVFFDDCVYSQYVFFMENAEFFMKNDIYAVFGFSTALFRQDDLRPVIETTSELHRRFHMGDSTALAGFMSLSELNGVLDFERCYLACHGRMHLDLDRGTGYPEFRKDV